MQGYTIVSLLGMLLVLAFWLGDYNMLWNTKAIVATVYEVGLRDYYFWGLCIAPSILSHFVTVWGHYFRADSVFQQSVSRVSWPATLSAEARKAKRLNQISIWEKHDPWWGYTVKYWLLAFIATVVNLVWFLQPVAYNIKKALDKGDESALVIWGSYIGFGSGYAAMGACGMILFLVLRRSMLHAIGFTYADLLPLHRGMGLAIIFWSVVHTIGYMIEIIGEGALAEEINFDGTTRGPQNIFGFVALFALCALGILSLPYVRRRFYNFFIWSHRYLTFFTFAGTLMHYPYFMTWYYVVPSMCLFLADRFIPKIVQAFSVAPDVICSYDSSSDILTVVVTSKNRLEPLKPYYPGDYVNLQVRSIGEIYHPFTIASYWAEDPYSMTIYLRTFGDNKDSWTHAVAGLCEKGSGPTVVQMNVDGVFGDRLHDYLCSDVMVIFAAGAALTTFMPLIKSVAAHIDVVQSSTSELQNTIKVHLICTFRYESELYSYGGFLHQITHDPRFTSWLKTDIHVSRPNKIHSRDSVAASHADSHTEVASQLSPPIEVLSSDTHDRKIPHRATAVPSNNKGLYDDRALPTFLNANSASVSTLHATRDLALTAVMLLIPLALFIGLRFVSLEGNWEPYGWYWCRTTEIYDQNMTNKCMWNYTMTPGTLQIVLASIIGYGLIYFARRSTRKAASVARLEADGVDDQVANLKSVLANQQILADGSIQFKPVRLDIALAIEDLITNENVGVVSTTNEGKKADKTTVVFVGGPDNFLDSVETLSKKASWSVEFHRETWSP
ncbi:hypothetical protein EMPS_05592 [Entomortierella parvispora]|uniref:FAD-binding FR-type domain-containing protein n=1 Tax=Entomortierella parvispora TaxID=205924 RepID=A0A9P3HAR0_9FUNG|nr:hypothetical protein EMPS_05592 [Entomortierella parvispora]